ncbi:MAG: anaerobic ribonucleoside-triphosphate reductase activating protein [bacterium]
MRIEGVQAVSLVDYPGTICSTVFLGGCNFRCPFCHNVELVLKPGGKEVWASDKIVSFMERRRRLVPAVCVSGGEPTLEPALPGFLRRLKTAGFKVKLDTNGSRPKLLQSILRAGLVDYVAMDIKAPAAKYSLLTGGPVNLEAIAASVDIIRAEAPAYEFRTTVVPGLLDEEDLVSIGKELAGVEKYVLQQFRPSKPLLEPELEDVHPYPLEVLEHAAERIRMWISDVTVRG